MQVEITLSPPEKSKKLGPHGYRSPTFLHLVCVRVRERRYSVRRLKTRMCGYVCSESNLWKSLLLVHRVHRIALKNCLAVLKVLVVNSAFLYTVPILSVNCVLATDRESCLPSAGDGLLVTPLDSPDFGRKRDWWDTNILSTKNWYCENETLSS